MRDVDEDRIEQTGKLFRVHLEVVEVIGEGDRADHQHSFGDPTLEAGALIACEVKAARALQVVEKSLEIELCLRHGTASRRESCQAANVKPVLGISPGIA